MTESMSFLSDRPPLPPWGTLEAIEVPGYPQSHMQVPRLEHRDALAALVRSELTDPETPVEEDANLNKSLGPPVSLEQDGTESLIFYLHEDAWGRDGPMVGCLGLWRTEQERQAGLARIGAFATHRFERRLLEAAAYCLIAQAQETWGWGTLDGIAWAPIAYNETPGQNPPLLPLSALPYSTDLTYGSNLARVRVMEHWTSRDEYTRPDFARGHEVYPAKGLMVNSRYQWEGARRFYSSESGALSSEWYDESYRLHKALGKDMELCEEGVIVNGMYNLNQLRSFIMPHLASAIKRGIPVEVSMSEGDLSDEYHDIDTRGSRTLAHQLEEMGATVEVQPTRGMHHKRIIIDRRIFWEPAHGLTHGYMTRTVAAKQIPLLLIRDRQIV